MRVTMTHGTGAKPQGPRVVLIARHDPDSGSRPRMENAVSRVATRRTAVSLLTG